MSISNEIKGLIAAKGLKKSNLQEFLGLKYPQGLSTKFARDSWTAQELINVVNFLGGEIVIKIDNREIILKI